MIEKKNAKARVFQRSTPATNVNMPCGYSPLMAATICATNATTSWAMPRKASTKKWGMRATNLIQTMVSAAQARELRGG